MPNDKIAISPIDTAAGARRLSSAQSCILPSMTTLNQMANAIRALAMDAVQQANSGHPGAPMGMAEMAVALWGPKSADGALAGAS